MSLPTPHLEKLKSVLENDRLPDDDAPRIQNAIERYHTWIEDMSNVEGEREEVIEEMVSLLNDYKKFIELDLVFDSDNQYLYRYKGQIKIENTIIEEFLPHLVTQAIPDLEDSFELGPQRCFSSISFDITPGATTTGGNPQIKQKDQDFAISQNLHVRTSHTSDFEESVTKSTHLGYVCAECKTNLDKTMFQEATGTAHDVKSSVRGAKYFLLCEWLDMSPLSTDRTDIDEVLILRQASRLGSNDRAKFGSPEGREENRDLFVSHIEENPFSVDIFSRFIEHITDLIGIEDPEEDTVLEDGYF